METNILTPFKATHPGILIADELEVRDDITQKDLATLLDVKPSFLNEIIKGKRAVTADIAILLEKALDIPADYWMKFQSQYEIDTARIKEKNITKLKLMEIWNVIKQYVPVKYFKKKGYLTDNLAKDISKIQLIYSINSLDELIGKHSEKRFSFFRKSEKLQIDERNMIAWTSLAEYEAQNKETNIFNFENLPQLNKELKEIFFQNSNTLEKVDRILSQYGIKFLIIDKLDKTPIDGYSFWSKNNPAIAMTLRHSRIDNFAFVLTHEIGHINLHLKKDKCNKFLDLKKIEENEIEEQANRYAKENLISSDSWKDFAKDLDGISDEMIYEFSDKNRVNPGIVLGRICFESNNFNIKTTIKRNLN